jgi:hypothetical protein
VHLDAQSHAVAFLVDPDDDPRVKPKPIGGRGQSKGHATVLVGCHIDGRIASLRFLLEATARS